MQVVVSVSSNSDQFDRQPIRCLVTGASGFLGSWLVRKLLARGHSISVLVRAAQPTPRTADWFHRVGVVPGSFDDLAQLRHSLVEELVNAIFHLSWSGVTAGFRNRIDQITTNVTGTLALCNKERIEGSDAG